MDVLHEEVIDRIRDIREDDSLRLEMRAGFAMIMKRLDDHAIPGEAADRAFAATAASAGRPVDGRSTSSTPWPHCTSTVAAALSAGPPPIIRTSTVTTPEYSRVACYTITPLWYTMV